MELMRCRAGIVRWCWQRLSVRLPCSGPSFIGRWRATPTNAIALGKSGEPDKLSFREGLKFNPSYWYVVALCFTFYSGIFPFRTFAIDIFSSKILSQMGAAANSTAAFAAAQRTRRVLQQRSSLLRHDRHSPVRSAGRQDRQARHPYGRRARSS